MSEPVVMFTYKSLCNLDRIHLFGFARTRATVRLVFLFLDAVARAEGFPCSVIRTGRMATVEAPPFGIFKAV